jgi:hypothetical protein
MSKGFFAVQTLDRVEICCVLALVHFGVLRDNLHFETVYDKPQS